MAEFSAGTFSISNFRAQLDQLGGISRTTTFRVELYPPPTLFGGRLSSQLLTFFCCAVTMPGVRITNRPVQRYGIGPVEQMPTGFEFDNVILSFIGDADGAILQFFRDWSRGIVEYVSDNDPTTAPGSSYPGSGPNVLMNGALPYYVNYKDQYQTQVNIVTYTPDGQKSNFNMELLNSWPVNIGDIQLNWGDMDRFIVVPVRFSFVDVAFNGQQYSSPNFLGNVGSIFNNISNIGFDVNQITAQVNQTANILSSSFNI